MTSSYYRGAHGIILGMLLQYRISFCSPFPMLQDHMLGEYSFLVSKNLFWNNVIAVQGCCSFLDSKIWFDKVIATQYFFFLSSFLSHLAKSYVGWIQFLEFQGFLVWNNIISVQFFFNLFFSPSYKVLYWVDIVSWIPRFWFEICNITFIQLFVIVTFLHLSKSFVGWILLLEFYNFVLK